MLEVKNISKHFGEFSIKDISFTVNPSDYFVLLGVSGAGKSILLEIIAGLIHPEKGEIYLNNKNITHQRIQDRKLGLVFQDHAVFPHMTVFENIAYPLRTKGLHKDEIKTKVEKLAETTGINHLLKRYPSTLSGGELQRTALSRTLALEPEILLLDEPLSSLDVQLKREMRSLLRKLNNNGQTIIHVTHDYEEAISLSNRVAVMHNGTIVQEGRTEEVFHHPKSSFVAEFVGVKNFFHAQLISQEPNKSKLARITDKVSFFVLTDCNDCDGTVMIGANEIFLSNSEIDSTALNNFKGKVKEIIPSRIGIDVVIDIGVDIIAEITRSSLQKLNITEGSEICLSFKATSVRFNE